jgi:hypothetical protein
LEKTRTRVEVCLGQRLHGPPGPRRDLGVDDGIEG